MLHPNYPKSPGKVHGRSTKDDISINTLSDQEILHVQQANMIASASYLAKFYSNDDLKNLDMRQALIEQRGMNPALAIAFEEQFEVVDMSNTDDGFQAITVRNKKTGEISVGIAGTNEGFSKDIDDLKAIGSKQNIDNQDADEYVARMIEEHGNVNLIGHSKSGQNVDLLLDNPKIRDSINNAYIFNGVRSTTANDEADNPHRQKIKHIDNEGDWVEGFNQPFYRGTRIVVDGSGHGTKSFEESFAKIIQERNITDEGAVSILFERVDNPSLGPGPQRFSWVKKDNNGNIIGKVDCFDRTTSENINDLFKQQNEYMQSRQSQEQGRDERQDDKEGEWNDAHPQMSDDNAEKEGTPDKESETQSLNAPFTYAPKDEKDEENSPDLITGWPISNKEDKHPLFEILNMGERPLSPDELIFTTLPEDVPEEDVETLDASICLNFWSRYW